jgi:nucleolar protein 15
VTSTLTLKTGKGSAKRNAKLIASAARSVAKDVTSKLNTSNTNVIYLGHVPLALTESEITSFLTQFGPIMAVHLSRSKKTGNPKGFAFVKFMDAPTAKIVSEVLNGYFLDNRRMVSHVIPQHALDSMGEKIFKGKFRLIDFKKQHAEGVNKVRSVEEVASNSKAQNKALGTKVKKLGALGIADYGFEQVLTGAAAVVVLDADKSSKKKRKNSVEEKQVDEEVKTPKAKKSKTEEVVFKKSAVKKVEKVEKAAVGSVKKAKKEVAAASTPKASSKASSSTPKSSKKSAVKAGKK